ncbi:MAG: glycine cleavage system protein GcvH [Chloroflexi bacterium]|nr:glycine cleavage system protein GcvH [Chloroflexota bacterium]
MNIPKDLKYTPNDEWLRVEGKKGTIGITDYAQDQLSDIVFIEYTVSPGDEIKKGTAFGTVESVKAASDIYLPVSGKVLAINEGLQNAPETVNSDPYGKAWMIEIELTEAGELEGLLDAAGYEQHCKERDA